MSDWIEVEKAKPPIGENVRDLHGLQPVLVWSKKGRVVQLAVYVPPKTIDAEEWECEGGWEWNVDETKCWAIEGWFEAQWEHPDIPWWFMHSQPTHWMALPEPPEVSV